MLKNLRIGRLSACSQFFYCLLAGLRRNRSEFAAKQSVFWLKNSVSAVKNGKNRHKNKAEKARLRVEKERLSVNLLSKHARVCLTIIEK